MALKYEFNNIKELQTLIYHEAEKILKTIIKERYPDLEDRIKADEYFDPRDYHIEEARLSAKKLIFGLPSNASVQSVKYYEDYYKACDRLHVSFSKSYSYELLQALESAIKQRESDINFSWEYSELSPAEMLKFQEDFEKAWQESYEVSKEHNELLAAFGSSKIEIPLDSYRKKIKLC